MDWMTRHKGPDLVCRLGLSTPELEHEEAAHSEYEAYRIAMICSDKSVGGIPDFWLSPMIVLSDGYLPFLL